MSVSGDNIDNLMEIAQAYIDREISVTPVDSDKKPFGTDWQSRIGEKIFSPKWAWAWKKAKGIGLLCGEHSRIIVLDIDITSKEKDPNKLRILNELNSRLPPLYSGRIGSKEKPPARFFQFNGETNEKFKYLDIEILSTGNQALIPPSIHPSGYPYEWVGRSLLDIDVDDLPFLDEEILVWLRQENERLKKNGNPEDFLRSVPGRCKSGSHNRLSSIGVAMRIRGVSPDSIVSELIKEDQKINANEDSLYFKCQSRHEWKQSTDINENAKRFVDEICKRNAPDPKHEKYPTLKTGFFKEVLSENKKIKWVPDFNGMGLYFRDELNLKCDDSYLSIYSNDYFKKISKTGLLHKINRISKGRAQPHQMESFKKKIKAICYYDKEEFEPPVGLINVANGVLDVKNRRLLAHDPKYNFKYKLAHNYEPSAKAPRFFEFLNFIFEGDSELIKLVGEIMGYTLIGGPPTAHRAFVFYGDGRNGKSTLLDIITQLLGEESVSAVSMDLIQKPFSTVRMDGKLANIVEESPTNINAETFKNIVSGGRVAASHKGMEEFDLRISARMFFACNEFPRFKDGSVAIKDRLVIMPFNRYIRPDERDTSIHSAIMREMSGVLNFAIEGYERFKSSGFTQSKAVDSAVEEYLNESDSVRCWFNENITLDWESGLDAEPILLKDFFKNYETYCQESNRNPVAYNTFSKRMRRAINDRGQGEFNADLLSKKCSSRENWNKIGFVCLKFLDKFSTSRGAPMLKRTFSNFKAHH